MNDVILHAFDWPYTQVTRQAQRIAELGYGAVLLPPPLYSDPQGKSWWQRYQPKDYRVIRSFLGNKAELIATIEALHKYGVKVYVDIVFNHMANENRPDPLNSPGAAELTNYLKDAEAFEQDRLYGDLSVELFSSEDFHHTGDIEDWLDPKQSVERSLSGLPDLKLTERVITQQRLCLQALNKLGIDGYRIDAIKHLPEQHVHSAFEDETLKGKFLFAESLTSNDLEEQLFLWPLFNKTAMSFYDFPLHETLRGAFSPLGSMRELVDPAAFGQALPKFRAVTFSTTHDMPNNEGFRGVMLQKQDEYLANAYLLARDAGVPLIYSDANQSAQQYPEDWNRWANAWQRSDLVAMVRFHNAVHGLPERSLDEHDGFWVFARGERGIAAINKTDCWQHPTIRTEGLGIGRYVCQIHGYRMQVTGDYFTFAIAPRQAQLWLYQTEA